MLDSVAGCRVVSAGVNLPAIATSSRLQELGAMVTKVEPPDGDLTEIAAPSLYEELTAGQTILRIDLKATAGRDHLIELLAQADVLVTSSRPSALARLGLAWSDLEPRFPRLVQVAIVGHAAPHQELAGHDLTYVAEHGLAAPPALPRTLIADLGGAERAATTVVGLLLGRERGSAIRYAEVALDESARFFALPWRHGVTTAQGLLGGGSPFYAHYRAREGWVALAALEPRFQARLIAELGLVEATADELAEVFSGRSAKEWQRWAEMCDLPLAAVP
jgi:alpha-methylacyl-CoA racemase